MERDFGRTDFKKFQEHFTVLFCQIERDVTQMPETKSRRRVPSSKSEISPQKVILSQGHLDKRLAKIDNLVPGPPEPAKSAHQLLDVAARADWRNAGLRRNRSL